MCLWKVIFVSLLVCFLAIETMVHIRILVWYFCEVSSVFIVVAVRQRLPHFQIWLASFWHIFQEPNIFPIITREWTADEELALIEGVEVLGFGNWEGIADMVGTKSKQKCRKHYLAHYIDCPTYPLPKFGENLQPVDGMELELSDGMCVYAASW